MTAGVAIDYVSPLPPVRSGIADYSRDLLPHLETLCDLRVARLSGQAPAAAIDGGWQTISTAEVGTEGRLPVYQMGNNRHHEAIFELAMERPGVVALHDVVLHHLLVEMTLGRALLEPYLERLSEDHGWIGELAAKARRWGELGQAAMFSLAAHRSLVRRQRGVLVHSHWAARRVLEDDPAIRVCEIPMAIPLPSEVEAEVGQAFRRRLGLGAHTPLLGSFGFQTPIKRTEQVIAALAQPGMEEAHLLIAGEVSPVLDFDAAARQVGVRDRVHCTGFLDFEDFEAAIAACDLCVNLRYPTAGETSASLLRVLGIGRPAIVSDFAHSSELPDDIVVKIPVGEGEVAALAQRVGALLVDRPRLRSMSRRARRYIAAEHDPDRAARAVVEACQTLGELQPPGDRRPDLPPPTTLLWRELWGELRVSGCEPPWPVGEARQLRLCLTNHGPASWLATRRGIGGMMLEVQWRPDPWRPAAQSRWVELPEDLRPGQSREFRVRVRRPLGTEMLVVEPHLRGVSGCSALGGPVWVGFL